MTVASRYILGLRVDATSYSDASEKVIQWARNSESRYVCVATVNNVMEAHGSQPLRNMMNAADLVTPDGMPLVWGLGLLGVKGASRVYGPDLTPCVLAIAEREAVPVAFYGASSDVLDLLLASVRTRFPKVRIAYAWSPPFRPLSDEEDHKIVRDINSSGARILFVGMSTPKQDRWMAEHKGRVSAVMLGIGAAFDFLAGKKAQAPRWMMGGGLEWLFRLVTEPRRLWRRYLKQNPRFMYLFAMQLLHLRRFPDI
jgi:N-acetylglucosaminyldiphosphoundecaprenol N-acetyl-beta-D-mannosaminyltransferase